MSYFCFLTSELPGHRTHIALRQPLQIHHKDTRSNHMQLYLHIHHLLDEKARATLKNFQLSWCDVLILTQKTAFYYCPACLFLQIPGSLKTKFTRDLKRREYEVCVTHQKADFSLILWIALPSTKIKTHVNDIQMLIILLIYRPLHN